MSKQQTLQERRVGRTDVIGILDVGFVAGVHCWLGNQVEGHVPAVDVVLDSQLWSRQLMNYSSPPTNHGQSHYST